MKQQTRQGITCIIVCLVITVAGGIAGLGYMTYCAFFSGELAGEYALSTSEPTTFELTPEMSPVAVTAGATFVVPRGQFARKHAVYEGTLQSSNKTIWEGQFGGSVDDDEYPRTGALSEAFHATKKYVLPAFSVEETDTYVFTASESFEPDLEVVGLSLTVRKNIREPYIPFVVAGCIAMGIGILGLVFFGIRTIRGAVLA